MVFNDDIDIQKPHPHIVLMPDAEIYLHGNQCVLDETHMRTAVLQADAVWVSVVGEGAPGQLRQVAPGTSCPSPASLSPIVANAK